MQTAVVWSCFPFIRSGQNHLARHSERGKKTRRTKEEVGRQHYGMDRPGVRRVPESSGERGKTEKTGCRIICSAPTTLAVKGLMMMKMSLMHKSGFFLMRFQGYRIWKFPLCWFLRLGLALCAKPVGRSLGLSNVQVPMYMPESQSVG